MKGWSPEVVGGSRAGVRFLRADLRPRGSLMDPDPAAVTARKGAWQTMSWTDNDDLTEPNETDAKPIMGVTGGQRAAVGDYYVLQFLSDGDEIETSNGTRAAFDAALVDTDFSPVDGDGHRIEEGDAVRFMTGSARFLSELEPHAPVEGKVLRVDVRGVGYDAEYAISDVTDETETDE